ncbi:MAG: cyanophycin synthetase family protein, partial [Thermoplasmatota archaeon]
MGEGKITIVKNGCMEGPNVFALFPVLEGIIDLDKWSETPSTPTCAERLIQVLPELKKHRCSRGHTGGFVERLNEGTYPEHIIEHVSLALQNKVGCDVAYGKSRRYDGTLYQIALEYDYKPVASSALRGAVELVDSLLSGEKSETELQSIVDSTVEEEIDLMKKAKLGPSTSAILEAARRRGIPFDRQHDDFNLYSLGWGKNRKMIWGPVTSETSLMGSDIAQDKELTKNILYRSGFPVPDGELVNSLEEAVEVSDRLGYPVVIKPLKGHHGEGVVGDLRNKEEVERAYEITRSYSSDILVEKYLHGEDHRFLMVDSEVVAVAKRIPPYVVGDGESTIRQLVDLINKDPMRSEGHTSLLTEIELGNEEILYLDNIGKDPETIPEEGEKVYLRSGGNLS